MTNKENIRRTQLRYQHFVYCNINDCMLHDELIKCAIDEIDNKKWGVVEEFFKIHDILYSGDEPQIDRIDTEKDDDTAIVYFPVKDEKFHLAMYLSTKSGIAIKGVSVESRNEVYFMAYSETYSCGELSQMTNLKPTEEKNIGDQKKFGKSVYKESWIAFEPNPEPDEFEDKLNKLLDFLEHDKAGVKRLVDNANGSIKAQIVFHNGNTILGGPQISRRNIQRMASLNLEINFDLYAEGNKWE